MDCWLTAKKILWTYNGQWLLTNIYIYIIWFVDPYDQQTNMNQTVYLKKYIYSTRLSRNFPPKKFYINI